MSYESVAQKARVLLVEDCLADLYLTEQFFKTHRICADITIKRNGEEAWNTLTSCYAENIDSLPDFIITDLDMPRMDGRELLMHAQSAPVIRDIPIIVLSGSIDDSLSHGKDLLMLGAQGFIEKPLDMAKLEYIINTIENLELTDVSGEKHLLWHTAEKTNRTAANINEKGMIQSIALL